MPSKNQMTTLLTLIIGFGAGFMAHPLFSPRPAQADASSHLLEFDTTVTAYQYSEKGVIGIEKIDDQSYCINAVRPGMCAVSFSTNSDEESPEHTKRNQYIVTVSPEKKLTIQETKFWRGGML